VTAAGRHPRTYRGTPLAPGIAVGPARVVDLEHLSALVPRHRISERDIPGEIERLKDACARARKSLQALAEKVEKRLGRREADIIRPQSLMAEDPAFVAEAEELIVEDRCNAEAAVAEVIGRFERMLESVDDPYLRERTADIRDVGRRVLGHLLSPEGELIPHLEEPSIVVASHLLPSLTVHLERDKILGFATEKGGYTSHAAILARSLGIPAVTGLDGLAKDVVEGETLVVDGNEGVVVVAPGSRRLRRYARLAGQHGSERARVEACAAEPSVTRDGVHVRVQANVGRIEEVKQALAYAADGIGLYRTEFDYLSHRTLPTEDALAEEYGRAASAFADKGVVLRALDIGGDKIPPSVPLAHEENPLMGMRGLRLMLQRAAELMLPQLRAIVRAGARGKVSVLYPMVASVEDLEAAKALLEKARQQVAEAGLPAAERIEQGIMIEVPACLPMLPELLERCEFASVGTNDLVQYLLAADRDSERMVEAYDPSHPAVIRVLEMISRASRQAGKPLSICGEVASDAAFLPLLVGLGYRTLSVNVRSVPTVKDAVRKLSARDCEALARDALKAVSAAQVRRLLSEFQSG